MEQLKLFPFYDLLLANDVAVRWLHYLCRVAVPNEGKVEVLVYDSITNQVVFTGTSVFQSDCWMLLEFYRRVEAIKM
ncbi:MAG: hypothetical protein IPO03_19165 [Bacteroidetes bacterium]|nr:hypothetical protein [Bacteroidota bacterium]